MRPHVFSICVFSMALMTSPLVSFAQQEIASDAGEVVLDATVNAIDVENRVPTITGPDGNIIAVKATPEVLGRVEGQVRHDDLRRGAGQGFRRLHG